MPLLHSCITIVTAEVTIISTAAMVSSSTSSIQVTSDTETIILDFTGIFNGK